MYLKLHVDLGALWLVTLALAYELDHPLQGILPPLLPSLCDTPDADEQKTMKETFFKSEIMTDQTADWPTNKQTNRRT